MSPTTSPAVSLGKILNMLGAAMNEKNIMPPSQATKERRWKNQLVLPLYLKGRSEGVVFSCPFVRQRLMSVWYYLSTATKPLPPAIGASRVTSALPSSLYSSL